METSRINDEREPENRGDAGIIYMEPKALGLDVLRESWVTRTLEACPCFRDTQFTAIMALCFDRYLFTSINFMRAQMSELLPTQDNNLCESLTRLLDCFLEPFCAKEGRDAPKKEVVSKAVAQLEARFIFSLVWSVGCTGPNESRARFDLWLRLQLATFGMKDKFPAEGLVYDYVRSPRFEVLRRLHFLGWTRVHLTSMRVVSLSISRPFGHRDAPRRSSGSRTPRVVLDYIWTRIWTWTRRLGTLVRACGRNLL